MNNKEYLEKRAEYALKLYPKALAHEKDNDGACFTLRLPTEDGSAEERAAIKAVKQAEVLLNALGIRGADE